jgi:tRNA threonylcarbamoyladenosine biosynthesis protein TsaE
MDKAIISRNEKELELFGVSLAKSLFMGAVVFLEGGLGAGKTTVARGILRGLGYGGIVPSPTYTLLETYELKKALVVHIDLYRIVRRQDLEGIGIREYFDGQTISLIEWPEKLRRSLPLPDLRILLTSVLEGRKIRIKGLEDNLFMG